MCAPALSGLRRPSPPPPLLPPLPPPPLLLMMLLLLLLSCASVAVASADPSAGASNASIVAAANGSLNTWTTGAPPNTSRVAVDRPRNSGEAGRSVGATDALGAFLRSGSVRLELPAVTAGDELQVDAGNELRIGCESAGRGPLLWSAPAAAAGSGAALLVAEANAVPAPAISVARRELRSDTANGHLTNLYCCARQIVYASYDNVTQLMNTDSQKCVYVFVKDPANPIVEVQSQIITIQGIHGRNVTVPCRPSSRDVSFTLKVFGIPRILNSLWYFHPRQGFTKVAAAKDPSNVECVSKTEPQKKQKFHLNLRGAAERVERPWLDAPLLLRAGASMPLNCSILLPKDFQVSFRFQLRGISAKSQLVAAEQNAHSVGVRKLVWQEAYVDDVQAGNGSVCCEVRDHVDNTNSMCSAVEVVPKGGVPGAPELRVRLDPRAPTSLFNASGATQVVRMERGPEIYWFVRVAWEGKDLPSALLRDPDNNTKTVDSNPKKSESHPRSRKPEVSVTWQPTFKDVPASTPGVARHSTVVVKMLTRVAEPGNYSLAVALGRTERQVALEVTLLGAPQPRLLNATPLAAAAGGEARVLCVARAEPTPLAVTWLWVRCNASDGCDDRGEPIMGVNPNELVDTRKTESGAWLSTLTLRDPPTGRWLRCVAFNERGNGSTAPAQLTVTAGGARGPSPGLVGGVVGVLALICGAAAACIYITLRQKRERRRLHCAAGLQGLVACEPGSLDPALPADEQAELLPYEARWEFPREDLILGRQLGAGAFGVVMKAEARGIVDDEEVTTVAVKMVKRGADDAYLRALASELKILVHLGRHLNVVNLLGACTGRIMERELLVIVEYCPYGNLHNYLLRHRDGFVDQVDPRSGRVDAARGAAQLAAAEATARRARLLLGSGESAYSVGGSPPGSGDSGALTAVTYCPSGGNCTSGGSSSYDSGGAAVPLSPLPTDDSSSSGGPQPLWRTLYRCDTRAPSRVLCTSDLLSWAYQVACGMQYLAQRKVLHGDLAARNVLLARDGIVKICDFGLARSMYKSDTYKKKGDGPLPIKWMALESIRDRIFSTQSDVWSFGVVMWELFSLGATPYPGMQPSEEFYNKLLSGYRMEHPPYAPRTIYDLMSACWETDPRRRPAFETLTSELGELLDISTREHFERLIAYEQQKGGVGGECDYLAMLGSPDYGALTSPEEHVYVNTPQTTEGPRSMAPEPNTSTNPDPELATDYLNMSRPSTPGTSQVSFY